jgi:putative transcription antitermination factor YqgF
MPGSRVIYLDVDDEITSAAARIRSVEESRVAVVLPYGSRVATSRINFRLLSRDALTHEKRLSIIAADAATRALAASAGLPVFASVAEYESSLGNEGVGDESSRGGVAPLAAATAGAAALGGATGVGAAPSGPAVSGPLTTAAAVGRASDTIRADRPSGPVAPVDAGSWQPGPVAGGAGAGVPPQAAEGVGGGGASRSTILVGVAILALAGLVAAVGAYLVLPSATIAVTPRPEAIGPVELTVVADPAAVAVDPVALVVPAQRVSIEVSAKDTFDATGKRVEETKASGVVRFENLDFLNDNTIQAGSLVGTDTGIRFRTNRTITVPRADIVGLSLFPGRATVNVTAVKAGVDGNVDPNTIVRVPAGEDPIALKVTNPAATSGGTHEEFPRITAHDVETATATLQAQLDAAFQAQMADPALAPAGTTLFPQTGVLGKPTPTPEPATLVGTEVATFELQLAATGTVVAVDTAAVEAVADAQLRASVDPGHELVPGSVHVEVGPGVAAGQTVRFPVTATAQQVAILDPEHLKTQVLGKSIDEAHAILEPYGAQDRVCRTGSDRSVVRWPGRLTSTSRSPSPAMHRRRVGRREPRSGSTWAAPDRAGGSRRDAGAGGAPRCGAVAADAPRRRHRKVVASQAIGELVVGLPLEGSGAEGPQAVMTRAWATEIERRLDLPLTFRDERLTSHLAEERLGPMKRGRSGGPPSKTQRDAYRARVDREAAAIILQDELDTRDGRRSSTPRTPDPQETSR